MNKPSPEAQTNQAAPTIGATVRELWHTTCVWFTALVLVILLLRAILSESFSMVGVPLLQFFLLLPFSFLTALAGLVRRSAALSTVARCLLHPLLCLGGFYLFLYLPYQIETAPSGADILMILFLVALVYAIGAGIYALCTRKKRRKKIDDTPYVSQFTKK